MEATDKDRQLYEISKGHHPELEGVWCDLENLAKYAFRGLKVEESTPRVIAVLMHTIPVSDSSQALPLHYAGMPNNDALKLMKSYIRNRASKLDSCNDENNWREMNQSLGWEIRGFWEFYQPD